jgi:hypothetical protein
MCSNFEAKVLVCINLSGLFLNQNQSKLKVTKKFCTCTQAKEISNKVNALQVKGMKKYQIY